MLQRVMSQIASVKKDMIILEKSEFSTLLAENEVSVVIIRSFPRLSYVTIYPNGVAGKSFSSFQIFSQKLKIQLLQLKVQLAVSDPSCKLKLFYNQVLLCGL